MISIIIPTYNEEQIIEHTLHDLYDKTKNKKNIPFEIIISDAKSVDSTVKKVKQYKKKHNLKKITIVRSAKGRSHQMNTGAKKARYPILLFLHADVHLPKNALQIIVQKLKNKKVVGGGFLKSYKERKKRLMLNLFLSWIRAGVFKKFFGNEAIFVRKNTFTKMNGFTEILLMEDIDFAKRLKKQGKVITIKKRVRVSARRYLQNGVVRQSLTNIKLLTLYALGADPNKLREIYEK